jgi:hypothetical protein
MITAMEKVAYFMALLTGTVALGVCLMAILAVIWFALTPTIIKPGCYLSMETGQLFCKFPALIQKQKP